MPNTREKLIELLECTYGQVEDRDYDCYGECKTCQAENLIANGVGFLPKWIPVSERLPEENGQYLVFQKHTYGTYTAVLQFAKDGRKVDKYDFYRGWKNVWYRYDSEWGHITIDDVTHWMPLPEPPKGE